MKYLVLASLAASAVVAQIPTQDAPFDSNTPLSTQVYADITGDNRNPMDLTGRTNAVQTRINGDNFYEDQIALPRGSVGLLVEEQNLPSARLISNTVNSAANGNPASARSISDWHTFWGQFIDHDFMLTAEDPAIEFNIEVPDMDPVFTIDELIFDRSVGENIGGIREQRNLLTSYIDASNTYGETNARALALRTRSGGLLLSQPGQDSGCISCDEIAVRNDPQVVMMASAGIVPDTDLYVGGDVRFNENIALAAVHTLWIREHNRYAREIDASGICDNGTPSGDECIYQEARRRVVAENQAITINEYSRNLFGDQYDEFIGPYPGFNETVVPGCTNEFGILFRYGHTELNEQIMRMSGRPGAYTDQGAVNLNAAFFNPAMLQDGADVDYILLGNTQQRQREIDNVVSDAVRNTLFILSNGDSNTGGDLVARNIQRAREHGQGSYTQLLQQIIDAGFLGSEDIDIPEDFSFLGPDLETVFDMAYGIGNVTQADSWPVAISEPQVGTAGVGQTLLIVISNQYRAIRDGDMFWYENTASPNPFTSAEINELNSIRLSDVILRNANPNRIEAMPCNAMEDGTMANVPGGVCENNNVLNSGNVVMASFGMVAALLFALF